MAQPSSQAKIEAMEMNRVARVGGHPMKPVVWRKPLKHTDEIDECLKTIATCAEAIAVSKVKDTRVRAQLVRGIKLAADKAQDALRHIKNAAEKI